MWPLRGTHGVVYDDIIKRSALRAHVFTRYFTSEAGRGIATLSTKSIELEISRTLRVKT